MENYTMKIETISTEENSHLSVDLATLVVTPELIETIVKARVALQPRQSLSIESGFTSEWRYEGDFSDERLGYDELTIWGDGDLIISCFGKHCGSKIESSFFRIEEVDARINAKSIAKTTQIEVCINSLSSFAKDEAELLVQFADLVSQSDIESKIILYADSLEMILNSLEDEDEYMDTDFDEFKTRINNLIQADADQYIFN